MRRRHQPKAPRDTTLGAARRSVQPSSGAVVDAHGCASQHYLPIGQWHTPRGGQEVWGLPGRRPRVRQRAHRFLPVGDAQRRLFGKFFLSSREAVAALGPARLQHRATGPGAHAMTKTVLLGSPAIVGLESSLHGRLLNAAPMHQRRCGQETPPTGLQHPALYRQKSIFSACGKPATVMSPSPTPWVHPHPVDIAVDG